MHRYNQARIDSLETRAVPQKGVSVSGKIQSRLYTAPERSDYRHLSLEHESDVEKAFLIQLDFQLVIDRLWTQKIFPIDGGYAVDIVIQLSPFSMEPPPIICLEVKEFHDLKENFDKYLISYRRKAAWFADQGLRFRLLTDRCFNAHYLRNATNYRVFISDYVNDEEGEFLNEVFMRSPAISRTGILEYADRSGAGMPLANRAVDKAIAQREILVDLEAPIGDHTLLRDITSRESWKHPYADDPFIRKIAAGSFPEFN